MQGFELELSYVAFKSIVTSKSLWWQCYADDIKYNIWVIDGCFKYSTSIYLNPEGIEGVDVQQELANKLDFETNYKDSCNRPIAFSPSATQSDFQGKQIEIAEGNSTGSCYWAYGADVYIRRALPIPINAAWGDYIEFTVVMDVEEEEVELTKYGTTIYFYGDKPSGVWYDGFGFGFIPVGCKVKCTYTAADTSGRKFIIHAEFEV